MSTYEPRYMGSIARQLPGEVAEKVAVYLSERRGQAFTLTVCPTGDFYLERWEDTVPDDVIGNYVLREEESRFTLMTQIAGDVASHVKSNGGRGDYMARRAASRKLTSKSGKRQGVDAAA